jgi:cytochrome P450
MGRYEEVRSALVNWQGFGSGNGVGLYNPRHETPYRRPQSVILELDPPFHDAARHAIEPLLGPRMVARFRDRWTKTADALIDQLEAPEPEASDPEELRPQGVSPLLQSSAAGA